MNVPKSAVFQHKKPEVLWCGPPRLNMPSISNFPLDIVYQ